MTPPDFADGRPRKGPPGEQLVLDLDGFEGPIDLLLSLARDQKVDLARISILALADQFLAYVTARHRLRLEIAADYLVMAAWLAYLKSRLLLPSPPADDEPSGAELAAALAHRLNLLAAMQRAGTRLMAQPQLGRDFFLRGAPEGFEFVRKPVYQAELYDLLKGYADIRRRADRSVLEIAPASLYSMDEALERLSHLTGRMTEWGELSTFLPQELRGGVFVRSALAATFAASLELARSGRIEIRQERPFGPIYLRRASPPPAGGAQEGLS